MKSPVNEKTKHYIMKQLIKHYNTDSENPPFALIREIKKSQLLIDNVSALQSEGYISTECADNSIFLIFLTAKGKGYFQTRRDNKLKIIGHWSINIATAVMSAALGAAFTYLISFLT